MPDLADRIRRRWLPRAVVALSQVTWPARTGAAARRALGRRGRVELYLAFDDPCSAVALLDLAERLAGRRVALRIGAVVRRGPKDDPATADKRRYAIVDARRLARRRLGLELARDAPIGAGATAAACGAAAAWVDAAPPGPALERFCAAAMRRIWFEPGSAEPGRDELAALWRATIGADPPDDADADASAAVARTERRMRRRGPYDTPAAVVAGRWFFAHDRPEQIADWLDELGWRAGR